MAGGCPADRTSYSPVVSSTTRCTAVANPSDQFWRSRYALAAGRNCSGGNDPNSPPNAPDSSNALVPAPWPLPDTSTRATSSTAASGDRVATTKSPEKLARSAERWTSCSSQPRVISGMVPLRPSRARERARPSATAAVTATTTAIPAKCAVTSNVTRESSRQKPAAATSHTSERNDRNTPQASSGSVKDAIGTQSGAYTTA